MTVSRICWLCAAVLLLSAGPSYGQSDTLAHHGEQARTWAWPHAYDPVDLGLDAFPDPQVPFVMRYATRFDPTEAGRLRTIRVYLDGRAPGRIGQHFATEPRYDWPFPFDHTPQTFLKQAVRFTAPADDTLYALEFRAGTRNASSDGFNDTLAVSLYPSALLVDSLQTFYDGGATTFRLPDDARRIDRYAARFTAPRSTRLAALDLYVDEETSSDDGFNDGVRLGFHPADTDLRTTLGYFKPGSDFTFALGIQDAREAYGVRFTADGPDDAVRFDAAEFFVFNFNDERFFTGFDTPANDTLVVTLYDVSPTDSLPSAPLAEERVAFRDLQPDAWNRVDFPDRSFDAGTQFALGFETVVVDNRDIISFLSGGNFDPPIFRTLVRLDGTWDFVASAPFYADRADRNAEIKVRAVLADPNVGVPDLDERLADDLVVPLRDLERGTYNRLRLPALSVEPGQDVWVSVALEPEGSPDRLVLRATDALAPPRQRSAARVAVSDTSVAWRYVPFTSYGEDYVFDVRAAFGGGALPDETAPLALPARIALSDLTAGALNAVRLPEAVPLATGTDVWATFALDPVGTPDRFSLVSGTPTEPPVDRSAAYVTFPDGTTTWSFLTNTLFARPYEFDVRAYFRRYADAPDDRLTVELRAVADDGTPGALLHRTRVGPDRLTPDGFIAVNVSRRDVRWAAGDSLFVVLRADRVGGLDELTLASDDGGGPSRPARSFAYVSTTGAWTPLSALSNASAGNPALLVQLGYDADSNTADEDAPSPSVFALDAVYPNPAPGPVHLRLHTPTRTPVTVEVFDVLGRRVATVADGRMLSTGTHTLTWTPAGLSSGLYLVRARAGTSVAQRTVVLAR